MPLQIVLQVARITTLKLNGTDISKLRSLKVLIYRRVGTAHQPYVRAIALKLFQFAYFGGRTPPKAGFCITYLSNKGEKTIKKFRLSSEFLDSCRLELKRFTDELLKIKNAMIEENCVDK